MYDPYLVEKVQKENNIQEAISKRKLVKKLTNESVIRKMTLRRLNDPEFRMKLFRYVQPEVLKIAIGNYIDKDGIKTSEKKRVLNLGIDWYGLAIDYNLRGILVSFFKINKIDNVEFVEKLVIDLENYNLDSFDSAAYNRVSLIKDNVEMRLLSEYDENYIIKNAKIIKYLLSSIRLALIIRDYITLKPYDYYRLIKLKNELIKIELNPDYQLMNNGDFYINYTKTKSFYNARYKIDANHFDLIEDFSDDFYRDLTHLICNSKNVSDSDFILKIGELATRV
jgi:hypothetical protein